MFACQLKKNTCIVSKIDHVVVASHTYATHSPPKKTWNTGKIVWTCLEDDVPHLDMVICFHQTGLQDIPLKVVVCKRSTSHQHDISGGRTW